MYTFKKSVFCAMEEFLLVSNTSRVVMTISKFFYDKHNFKVFEHIKEPELSNITRAVFLKVNDDCKAEGITSIEQMNLRAMSALKDAIRSHMIAPTPFTHQQQSAAPPAPNPSPLETAMEEDEFFAKMRLLEDTRKNFETPPSAPPAPQLAHPVPIGTVLPTQSGSTEAINTPQPAQPTQAAMISIKPSSVVVLNGWDRQVAFSPKRNTIVWAGPISPSVSRISIDAVLLPGHVSALTPYVILEIQGVGGQTETVNLISKQGASANAQNAYGSTPGGTWAVYEPVSQGHYITPLACPWTLRLFDAFKAPLNLGEDVATVVSGSKDSASRIYVSMHGDLTPGNAILLEGANGNSIMCNVTGKYKDQNGNGSLVELSQEIQVAKFVGATIVNIQKQFVVLLALF